MRDERTEICILAPMSYYFNLQWQIIKRKLKQFGINPILAIGIGLSLFLLLTYLLYQRTDFAPYLLSILALLTSKAMDSSEKFEFLGLQFSKRDIRYIRLIEHQAIALPFLVVLLVTGQYLLSFILLIAVTLYAQVRFKGLHFNGLPSPYKRFPFEFTIGFRKNILFLLLAYAIGITGCVVGNYNIAIFGMMILSFIMMNYYGLPEARIIIWEDIRSSKALLHYKLVVGLRYFVLTILPLFAGILFFYPAYWHYSLLWLLILTSYFLFFILMKYYAYPDMMSLPHTIYFIACIIIPPLMLYFAYRFYRNSLNNIKMALR